MTMSLLLCSSHTLLLLKAQHHHPNSTTTTTPLVSPPFLTQQPPAPAPAPAELPLVWWSDALARVEPDWQKLQSKNLGTGKQYEPFMEGTRQMIGKNYDGLLSGLKASLKCGLAQELIIGRAAMLGFLAAMSTEIESGQSLWQQLSYRGMLSLLFVVVAVAMGSLSTWYRERREDDSHTPFGPFTVNAERLNGQAAMLGFVLLLAVESAKGSALF